MTLSAEELIAYLARDLGIAEPVDAETELFSSGLLDSVSMIGLITFIEEKTRATIPATDVTLENFDSISRITDYARTLV